MKTILVNKAFTTNEYLDTPTQIELNFTEEEIEKIKKCIELAKLYDISINMNFAAEENTSCTNEYIASCEQLKIYSSGHIYYYSQNKYDAATQVESGGFTLDQLIDANN